MQTFQAGQTYSTRSIGDHNCIISVTVASRTAKTIKTTKGETFRVKPYYDGSAEAIKPWGSFSMAPTITADQTAALKRDWE